MTTQELKQYIDKVLGNSIRCLLPSYWWKRLFNQVADRIEDVEQSTSQLIDSKIEEVKMPIVESVDELEKLELPKGRVAAVEKVGESATVKISDCYFSLNWEEDWSKYTIVKGVEEKDNVITDNDAAVLFSASKEMVTKDALQVNKLKSGIFYYMKWTDDEVRISSLEEVNKALSSGKYRAINYVNGSDDYFIDDYFTFYSEKPQPSLYIKGDSWERLAKESDLEGIEGGSGDDVNEKIEDAVGAVVFYVDTNGGQLDDEYIAANAEQYKRLRKSDGMLANRPVYVKNYDGFLTAQMVVIDAYKKVGLIFETYEGRRLSVAIFPNGTYSDIADASSSSGAEIRELYVYKNESGSITELTDEQKAWNTETVELVEQGKAVAIVKVKSSVIVLDYIGDNNFLGDVHLGGWGIGLTAVTVKDGNATIEFTEIEADKELSSISQNPVKNWVITAALNNKVDKVEGKQLSTEDFTTALKTKLEGLNAFDPTEINNKVDGLQTQLDTLISGDASTAIESFNEIIAFLNGVTDSETLDGIIAGIEQQIAAKQEQLVSGTNIKTINGESVLGEGNIEIKADIDTTTLATKEELATLQNEVIANEEVTAAALNELNEKKADKEYVEDALGNVSVDTSTLVTKDEFTDVEEVWAASYNLLNQKISDVQQYIYDEAASRRQFDEAIAEIQSIIAENESVVTAAWNQLNIRINALEAAQTQGE